MFLDVLHQQSPVPRGEGGQLLVLERAMPDLELRIVACILGKHET
jgi:hypothetical protein